MKPTNQQDSKQHQGDEEPKETPTSSQSVSPDNTSLNIGVLAFCILIVWPFQYMGIIPLWLCWRGMVKMWKVFVAILKFAAQAGCLAIALLFVPIIGWGILLLWLLMRRSDKRYEALLQAIGETGADSEKRPSGSIWTPFLLEKVKGAQARNV